MDCSNPTPRYTVFAKIYRAHGCGYQVQQLAVSCLVGGFQKKVNYRRVRHMPLQVFPEDEVNDLLKEDTIINCYHSHIRYPIPARLPSSCDALIHYVICDQEVRLQSKRRMPFVKSTHVGIWTICNDCLLLHYNYFPVAHPLSAKGMGERLPHQVRVLADVHL
jgi:hypothetical protein